MQKLKKNKIKGKKGIFKYKNKDKKKTWVKIKNKEKKMKNMPGIKHKTKKRT